MKVGQEPTNATIATLLTFAIFFMEGIHVLLAAGLIGVYIIYLWASTTGGRKSLN